MADDSSTSEVQEAPVNCWQYSRDVYLIGRSLKMRRFTDAERAAVIEFIVAMAGTRPAYIPYINIKADNPPANEYVDQEASSSSEEQESERQLAWDKLEKQNDYSLAKMVQKIGRSLKVQFCTAEEKEICDALFEATDAGKIEVGEEQVSLRRFENYYVDPAAYETAEEEESSDEPESSTAPASSSEPESSSVEPQP